MLLTPVSTLVGVRIKLIFTIISTVSLTNSLPRLDSILIKLFYNVILYVHTVTLTGDKITAYYQSNQYASGIRIVYAIHLAQAYRSLSNQSQ